MKLPSKFAALTIAAAFLTAPLGASAQQSDNLPSRVTEFAMTQAPDDHVMGSEEAAQTMIIWASVACTHCSHWFTHEWPTVKSELIETGKLRVVFREYPTGNSDYAMTAFRLAACAPSEDHMSIIEFMMVEQENIFQAFDKGQGREAYGIIAEMAGMKTDDAISSCLRNPDITAHVVDNLSRARLAEIEGVPGFVINGQKYKGKSDAASLVALINEIEQQRSSAAPETAETADAPTEDDDK